MDPPPLPSSLGRFRIRVQIIAPEHEHNLTADPLRQFTVVKNPNFPLPDLTLRHLCNEVVKRYENLYPSERLFDIEKSQDSYGSDLYLDDRVRDVFEDNEVFRVIKGSTIRASVDPHRARSVSMQPSFEGAKRHMDLSEFDASRPGKRQRLHVDPDRPILSSEQEILQNGGQNCQKIESDATVIPDSQKMVDHAKSNNSSGRPRAESALPNGVSKVSPRDVSSSGSDTTQRRERPNLTAKRNTSCFETPTERRRSGSSAVTAPNSVQELSEDMPLNKKLKRPSTEPNNSTSTMLVKKVLPRADIYDAIETDYEEPITRPKRPISAAGSNESLSSLGINGSKWRSQGRLHTPSQQAEAPRGLAVTPKGERGNVPKPKYSVPARNTNQGKEGPEQRHLNKPPPSPTSIPKRKEEGRLEREKASTKLQKSQDAERQAREKEDKLAAEKARQKLEMERAETERKETEKREAEKKERLEIEARSRRETENKALQEAERLAARFIESPAGGMVELAPRWKENAAKTSLGNKRSSCTAFIPQGRSSAFASVSQPTIPSSSPISARDVSSDVQVISPKSAKRSVSFASLATAPNRARRSVSTTSTGSAVLKQTTLVPPRLSFTDSKTPSKRVSPRTGPNRFSSSKTSKDEAKLPDAQRMQVESVVISSTASDEDSSSAPIHHSKGDDSNLVGRNNRTHVGTGNEVDRLTEPEQQKSPVVKTKDTSGTGTEVLTQSHDSLKDGKSTLREIRQSEDSKSISSQVHSSSESDESESETSEATSEDGSHDAPETHPEVLNDDLTQIFPQRNAQNQLRRSQRNLQKNTLTDDETETQSRLDKQILTQVQRSSWPHVQYVQDPPPRRRLRSETRILPPGYSMSQLPSLRRMAEEALRTKDTNIAAAKERAIMKEQRVKAEAQRMEESSEDDDNSDESGSYEDDSDGSVLEAPLLSYNARKATASADEGSDTDSAELRADASDENKQTADEEHNINLARKGLSAVIYELDTSDPVTMSKTAKNTKVPKPTEAQKILEDENLKGKTNFGQLARMFQRNKNNNKGLRMASVKPLSKPK